MSKPRTTPTLPQVLAAQFAEAMRGAYIALPARVESYDAAKQSCSVQPLIKGSKPGEDGKRQPERDPVITNVPVVFPGAGAYSITFPIAQGDTVLLVFASRSLARWLAVGGEVDPGDERRQHINDAIAIAGLRSFNEPVPSSGVSGAAMVIGAPAVKIGSSTANDKMARESDLEDLADAIAGSVDGIGFGSALKTALSTMYGGAGWPRCQSIVESE